MKSRERTVGASIMPFLNTRQADRGQSTLEYLAIIVLVAAVVAALIAGITPVGQRIVGELQYAICRIQHAAKECKAPKESPVVAHPPEYYWCEMHDRTRSLGFNLVVRWVRGDTGASDRIVDYIDPSTGEHFSVVMLSGSNGIGLEGSNKEIEWRRKGKGSRLDYQAMIGATGEVSGLYKFDTHAAAKRFLESRRGNIVKRGAASLTGGLGRTIEHGAWWIAEQGAKGWTWLMGGDPSNVEQAPIHEDPWAYKTSIGVQGQAGFLFQQNLPKGVTVQGGFEAKGEAKTSLTYLPDSGERIFRVTYTGEVSGGAGASYDHKRSPGSIGVEAKGAAEGTIRLTVRFDDRGQPAYLELRTEKGTKASFRVGAELPRNRGSRVRAGEDSRNNLSNTQKWGRRDVSVTAVSLDTPEEREAFSQLFYANGFVAVPRMDNLVATMINPKSSKLIAATSRLMDDAQRVEATYRVREHGSGMDYERGDHGLKRRGIGVGMERSRQTVSFQSGRFIDYSVPNAQWRSLGCR